MIRGHFSGLLIGSNSLSDDLRSVSEQLSDGGKSNVDVEKVTRRLKGENDELMATLEEVEIRCEQESSKLLKLQLEHTQYKQSMESKLSEKDSEAENSRRNFQRQLEALQVSFFYVISSVPTNIWYPINYRGPLFLK